MKQIERVMKEKSLKDVFKIQFFAAFSDFSLSELKSKKRYLAFLVKPDFTIVLAENYHVNLAIEAGFRDWDALARGYFHLGDKQVEYQRTFPENTQEMEKAVREKLGEWIDSQTL